MQGRDIESYRSGLNVHRIAQIFRERNVDISTQHLMWAIRLFIAEEERSGGKSSAAQERHQGPAVAGEERKTSLTYSGSRAWLLLSSGSRIVAKQLRLARYLAASSLPPARPLELHLKTRMPKQGRGVTKAAPKAKAEPARRKAEEAELAKERRRAGQDGRQKSASSGPHRSEKGRPSLGR
jgi:hypothetical protein